MLNPRTWRETAADEARLEMFCPGAADGWAVAPSTGRAGCRASPRTTSACARSPATCPAPRLADWPITYDELEPYYLKVEWAFGVSGEAGANKFEVAPFGRLSLPADADVALRPEVHAGLRRARLELLPDAAGGAVAPLQRPQGDGRQRVRPAARRSDRHALIGAQRVHPGRGGDRPFRAATRLSCARACAQRPEARSRRRSTRTPTATRSSRRPICSFSPAARWRPRG